MSVQIWAAFELSFDCFQRNLALSVIRARMELTGNPRGHQLRKRWIPGESTRICERNGKKKEVREKRICERKLCRRGSVSGDLKIIFPLDNRG